MAFAERDAAVASFRRFVWERCAYTPFAHQAEVILASEGWTLTDAIAAASAPDAGTCTVLIPHPEFPDDIRRARRERRIVVPRPHGPAHTVANLGSYKTGKSFCAGALYAPGFAVLRDTTVQLVGMEYKTSRYEFDYLCDTLLSKSQGLGFKYRKYQNDLRNGRGILELRNGMTYEVMSWERKEALKGAEVVSYLWNEAYMLPGLEVINTTKQNLRAIQGYNYISTTPDRPWVTVFHEYGHGRDPDTVCVCNVDGSKNPYTFSLPDMMLDCPDWSMVPASVVALAKQRGLEPGGRMTRERFAISWQGKIGDFVGRVYNYQRGERLASPALHPHLFRDQRRSPIIVPTRDDIRLPQSATVIAGADTGTFMSATVSAIVDGTLIVLDEFPNYRYVGGEIELVDLAIPRWTAEVRDAVCRYTKRSKARAWVDPNSQFKVECAKYGLTLRGNSVAPELRTEIAREYMQAGKVLFMPWLSALPYEVEFARWPDDVSASGKYSRLKEDDHTLDPFEHSASRRPLSKRYAAAKSERWIDRYLREHRSPLTSRADVHLGSL